MKDFDFVETFANLFVTYFILYPIMYFGYNFLVSNLDMAEYRIPGFWLGMLGFYLIILSRNLFFRRG